MSRDNGLRLEGEIKLGREIIRLKEAGEIREGRPQKTLVTHEGFKLADLGVKVPRNSA